MSDSNEQGLLRLAWPIHRECAVIVANLFARARPRRQGSAAAQAEANVGAGAVGDRQASAVVAVARWTCCIVGLAVFASAQRPWAEVVLADRGAELLVEPRTGWELVPAGQLVVAIAVAVTLLCVATSWWPRARRLVPLVPLTGLALVGLAVSQLGAADPLAAKISRLRIGTFQTDRPVVGTAVGSGLWWCLAAGVFLLVVGSWWSVLERRAERRSPPARLRPEGA